MVKPGLDENKRYIIVDYQQQRPFASFLPGIAGRLGAPLWSFYVNRGQAIAGFGVESKDSPIMEYQPANKAYQTTPYTGFRTFIKLSRRGETRLYEPFSAWDRTGLSSQWMGIGLNHLELEETHATNGLSTHILYFILPGESFAGLVRRVTITNQGHSPVGLEILDGMPVLIPYGVNNFLLKELGRTVEAWMEVFNLDARLPFYRVRASIADKAEVETYQAGHFALAIAYQADGRDTNNCARGSLLPALVDPAAVFGQDTSLFKPQGFYRQPLASLLAQTQVTCGRTPCGMFACPVELAPAQSITFYSLYGHAGGLEIIERDLDRVARSSYFDGKFLEAQDLVDEQTYFAYTRSGNALFDAYCRQNFLDNVLRGGWPVSLGDPQKPSIYHIYSRKHGDLERDYNAFFLACEPYSQGEGSYRDINQNRREDVRFNPATGDYDITTFMSLIQPDGYNPRTVRGSSFTLTPENQKVVLAQARQPARLAPVLTKPFTPGRLLKFINDHQLELLLPAEEFLNVVMRYAQQHLEAEYFEGYWIDHWEYNLDLIQSYLAVYPECQEKLLFGSASLPFFDSPVFVQPRSCKYVLLNGVPRQIGSILEDKEKAALIAARPDQPHWVRSQGGRGEIYTASLFAKLALTVLLKFATLDPWGMGIEMEASRPGWYDALNGLPALFGSGMSETYELQRWIDFLRKAIQARRGGAVRIPVEADALLEEVARQLATYQAASHPERDFKYWDAVSSAREAYRASTRLGFDGAEVSLTLEDFDRHLANFQVKVTAGISRALELNGGLPPTYFTFQIDYFDVLPEVDAQGRPFIRAKRFTPQVLPLFLEGPVHAFKILPDLEAARRLHQQVRESALFDAKLKMYKVNASLASQPQDIGRARAFPPGWLENESIWLHMEYKYLLEMLKVGLYTEFYEDLKHTLIPFLDPQVYSRSTLENSSFLVSSAHPDGSLHGAGFVARLSGSTAEFLSIWLVMMSGKQPFFIQDGHLCLALQPSLPGWLFSEAGELSFRFLGSCTVTYHNPQRVDTHHLCAQRTVLHMPEGQSIEIVGHIIGLPYAVMVREGKIEAIDVWF